MRSRYNLLIYKHVFRKSKEKDTHRGSKYKKDISLNTFLKTLDGVRKFEKPH